MKVRWHYSEIDGIMKLALNVVKDRMGKGFYKIIERITFLKKNTKQRKITNYEVRSANYELRIANYELRIMNYELRIMNYELRITNCEL